MIQPQEDKLGYYKVDNIKFYSKIEAFEYSKIAPEKVKWHFNDEIYSAYDWTIEPEESISELYRQRAQQIRDKYDYIVLWFSGGADSMNILNSFIDNDIKLDEAVSIVNYEGSPDKHGITNGEIFHVAVPKIEQVHLKQPSLKHRIIDISKYQIDFFNKLDSKEWIYEMNDLYNPNNMTRQDIKDKIPDWMNMIDAGKKVVFLYGTCKPRVTCINGKYYWHFDDCIHGQSKSTQTTNKDWDFNELFYWSPDCPKLVIKQGHIIKKYLKNAPANDPNIVNKSTWPACYMIDDDISKWNNPWKVSLCELADTHAWNNPKKRALDWDKVHSLVYPGWIKVSHQIKPTTLIFTERDNWFFKLSENTSTAKYNWRIGMEHMWRNIPDYRKATGAFALGLRRFCSINYFLGE